MYPTIDSIVDAVISLGQGCLLYKGDVKKAIISFLWTPMIIIYWGTPGSISFILTRSSPWAYILWLCQRSTSAVQFLDFPTTRALFVQLSGWFYRSFSSQYGYYWFSSARRFVIFARASRVYWKILFAFDDLFGPSSRHEQFYVVGKFRASLWDWAIDGNNGSLSALPPNQSIVGKLVFV